MDIKQIEIHVLVGKTNDGISDEDVLTARLKEIKALYFKFDTIVVVVHGEGSLECLDIIRSSFNKFKGDFLFGWAYYYEWLKEKEFRDILQEFNILSLISCPDNQEKRKEFFSILGKYTPKLRVIMIEFVPALPHLDYIFNEIDNLVEGPQFIRFKYDSCCEDFDESIYQEFIQKRIGDYLIWEDGVSVSYYGTGAFVKNVESPKISLFRLKSGRYGANTRLNKKGYQYDHDISRLVESDSLRKTPDSEEIKVGSMACGFEDKCIEYVLAGDFCDGCHMREFCHASDGGDPAEIQMPAKLCRILMALSRPFFQLKKFLEYRLPEGRRGLRMNVPYDDAGCIKAFIESNRECFGDYEVALIGNGMVDITFEKNPTVLRVPPDMDIHGFIEVLEREGKDTSGLPEIAKLVDSGKITLYLNYLGYLDGRWRIFFFRLRETFSPIRVNAYPGSKRRY